jgi:hypothetical protein
VTRSRARLAGVLALPVVLTACGSVSSAAASLEKDAADASAALAGARGVGIALHFEDADGALVRALQDGPDGMPAALAEVVVGSRIDLRVAATDGRTLAEPPGTDLALAEQLRWYDSAFTVSTQDGDLLAYRSVDGEVYVTSDLDEVERVAAAGGEPLDLREFLAEAPEQLQTAHDDVRAGQWLHLPVAELLESMGGPAGEPEDAPFADGLPEGLLEDLQAAVEPHARLSDLGSEDGVRRVTVRVEVKALLEAVTRTVQESMPEDDVVAEELSAGLFDGLTDAALTGTLTIQDGHYRSLEVPLAGLVDLVDDPEVDVPDLGDSTLVVEVDDAVEAVEAPARVSELDLLSVFGEAFAEPALPEDGLPAPEDQAVLDCYEQAETEEQFEACEATA